MREILFRGKRKDNGEWLFGYLKIGSNGKTYMSVYEKTIHGDNWLAFEVDPETVGQYTNLTLGDTKVFEGDIILCHTKGARKKDKYHRVVLWEEAGFYTKIITPEGLSPGSWRLWEVQVYAVRKVIGNIHDNPELLQSVNKEEL